MYGLTLGVGNIALFLINNGVTILALPYYQMTLGLDPFLLSLAITIPLLISAIIGPWVGYYSDHFKSRYGRRKPFIFLSSILCGVFLWPDVGSSSRMVTNEPVCLPVYILDVVFYLFHIFIYSNAMPDIGIQ